MFTGQEFDEYLLPIQTVFARHHMASKPNSVMGIGFADGASTREPADIQELRDKVCFIHIPKTGGLSVGKVLGKRMWKVWVHMFPHETHKEEWKALKFRFVFVRNPWDRLVSVYHFCLQNTDSQVKPPWLENPERWADIQKRMQEKNPNRVLPPWFSEDKIENFREAFFRRSGMGVRWWPNFALRLLIKNRGERVPFDEFVKTWLDESPNDFGILLRPQTQWFCQHRPVDFIGRYERIADDMRRVCKIALGEDLLPEQMPHVNKTDRNRDYRVYYDTELAERVGKAFIEDVDMFGYTFE